MRFPPGADFGTIAAHMKDILLVLVNIAGGLGVFLLGMMVQQTVLNIGMERQESLEKVVQNMMVETKALNT